MSPDFLPGRLYVSYIIKVQARQSKDSQIPYRIRTLSEPFSQSCISGLEAPWHKRREAARFILEAANPLQVFQYILILLDMSKHHCRS